MQAALMESSSIFSPQPVGGFNGVSVNQADKMQFEQMIGDSSNGIPNKISNIVGQMETKFTQKQVDIVKSLKSFEESGGAVALMAATHQGANNSIMVQLCGTVSKKCADNAEQLYKQQ